MGVAGKKFLRWEDLLHRRQITLYTLMLHVLKDTGKKGGAHSVASDQGGRGGIAQGSMGRKGNKETFSP